MKGWDFLELDGMFGNRTEQGMDKNSGTEFYFCDRPFVG